MRAQSFPSASRLLELAEALSTVAESELERSADTAATLMLAARILQLRAQELYDAYLLINLGHVRIQ